MNLGTICHFKTNFPDADFWLQRKGSEKTVGTPTKKFSEENIGVKVKDEYLDRIDPNYLYYYFTHLHNQGVFGPMSNGILELKNIRISDIKLIPIRIS